MLQETIEASPELMERMYIHKGEGEIFDSFLHFSLVFHWFFIGFSLIFL